jgi:CubicO group peptidase (beta-lactamase class C family)
MIGRRIRSIENPPIGRSDREVEAGNADLDPQAVERIWASVLRYYRRGLHPAMALSLRVRGKVVLDRSVGYARGNGPDDPPGTPLIEASPDTPFNLFSASKPITAMLVLGLVERGELGLDDPVARFLPELDSAGKRDITVRHVLSHRAGLPGVPDGGVSLDRLADHAYFRAALRDGHLDTVPGSNSAYHALSGGYLLWELVRAVSGRCLKGLQEEWVCKPMGLKLMNYGLPEAYRPARAVDVFTGPPVIYPVTRMLQKSLGVGIDSLIETVNDPRFLDAVVPSANVFASANEACLYFEMLRLGGGFDSAPIFETATIERATKAQHFSEFDSVIRLPIDYGLGFMLGNDLVSLFGPRTGGAFGHMGFTNILVWADPRRQLSGAFLSSGKPLMTPEILLWVNVVRTIAAQVPRRAA